MKAIINKFLHWLIVAITSVVALVAVLMLFLQLVSPSLEKYHARIEEFVSQSMSQPIAIGRVELCSRGFQPILKLHDVKIFNDPGNVILLQIKQFEVGIDLLGSLFNWQLEPGLLVVKGTTLALKQTSDGKIVIAALKAAGANATSTNLEFASMAEWLLTQGKVEIDDLDLSWHAGVGKITKLTNLHLVLKNRILQHDVELSGNLVQGKSLGEFISSGRIQGNAFADQAINVNGEIMLKNLTLGLANSTSPFRFPFAVKDVTLKLYGSQLNLDCGALFRNPLAIDDIAGIVNLRVDPDGWKITASRVHARNHQIDVNGGMELASGSKEQGPIIDLRLSFQSSDIPEIKTLVPQTVLSADLVAWLENAFLQGKSAAGTMLLQGPLHCFPFTANEGHFLIDTDIEGIKLNYRQGWPTIDNICGRMIFENSGMRVDARSTSILGAKTGRIQAEIPNLNAPILTASGNINVDSHFGLDFIFASPLASSIGRNLQGMELHGPMQLGLKLILPLNDETKPPKVLGTIKLHNNELHLVDWNMTLFSVNGELRFTEDDLLADQITAKLFSAPVTLQIKPATKNAQDHITEVDLTGSANLESVKKYLQFDFLSYLNGEANYKAILQLHGDARVDNSFKISSDLNGVQINLPEPFAKDANVTLDSVANYTFGATSQSYAKITYADRLNAVLSFEKKTSGKKQLFGGDVVIGPGVANLRTKSGLHVSGGLAKVSWPVWHDFLFAKKKDSALPEFLQQLNLDLNLNQLHAFGQNMHQVKLHLEPATNGWLLGLANTNNIQGEIFLPTDLAHGQIHGQLKKLYLQESEKSVPELAPTDFPALHFVINDFRHGATALGQVELITTPKAESLQIDLLHIIAPRFALRASGNWGVRMGKAKTNLQGTLTCPDFGALLKELAVTENLIGGSANANFAINWPSAFFDPDFKNIAGTFAILIKKGRIINLGSKTETELGFGRVLNLLSLQTLPRRLTLDFSDLVKQGFSFDTLAADLEISDGSIYTDNMNLDGPAAQVKADGRVGFRDKDYDMVLTTIPHLTSSIPVIAAIAGGPILGVATYVADKIISSAVTQKVSSYIYRVRGSWDNPKIDKL